MPKTAWLTLVHHRPWLLPLINLQRIRVDPTSIWAITLDRPSTDVIAAVNRLKYLDDTVVINESPFPALGDRERFNELRDWQVKQVAELNPEYYVLQDDDHILSSFSELRLKLRLQPDIIYATKIFLWNDLTTVNTRFPRHRSSFVFKQRPDETFPPLQMDEGRRPATTRVTELQNPLLDIGYLKDFDRRRCWEAYKAVGKIDAATTPLIETPRLQNWLPQTRRQLANLRRLQKALQLIL